MHGSSTFQDGKAWDAAAALDGPRVQAESIKWYRPLAEEGLAQAQFSLA
jgi:hypothetical protein